MTIVWAAAVVIIVEMVVVALVGMALVVEDYWHIADITRDPLVAYE